MKKTTRLVALIACILVCIVACTVLIACNNECDPDKHVDANHDGVCDVCGKEGLTVTHDWSKKDGVCTVCKLRCTHDFDDEAKCRICGLYDPNYSTTHYPHTFVNGVCSEPTCGWECVHKDNTKYFKNSVCDLCGFECVDHQYDQETKSGKCTVCGAAHKHNAETVWNLGYDASSCEVCYLECKHPNWTLGVCDTCSYTCDHHEGYSFGICSHCGSRIPDGFDHTHDYSKVESLCSICGQSNPDHKVDYTQHLASGGLLAMWNVLNYQANSAQTILDYTNDDFYTFDYNNLDDITQSDGYQMILSMLAKDPEDVTMNYQSDWTKWGIAATEGEGGTTVNPQHRIWKLTLRSDLKFDNGDPITAETFIESAKRLIDPDSANYRADGLWGSTFIIAGAKDYFNQKQEGWRSARDVYSAYVPANDSNLKFTLGNATEVAALVEDNKSKAIAAFRTSMGFPDAWPAANVQQYLVNNYLKGVTVSDLAALEGKTMTEIKANDALKATWDAVIGWWQSEPNEELDFFVSYKNAETIAFDKVGIQPIAGSTTEFYIVLEQELEGFYLKYRLGSLPLVHIATYDRCAKTENGIYTNSYGTSVDTYVGYGPYKLVAFVADSIAVFERNNYWWGYTSGKYSDHSKYYQTQEITIRQVADNATRFEMFKKGELDSYTLQEEDMADYQSSQYTYYTDGDSTWFVALNPDMDGLKSAQQTATPLTSGNEVNKTVLTIKEFRQALSFSIDRAAYNLALSPTSGIAKAIFSNMIIYDPDLGDTYRSHPAAKNTILAFWGLSNWDTLTDPDTGEKLFADIDEAIESITGYNLPAAREYFKTAYTKAVNDGLISQSAIASGKWEVQIMIGQPGNGGSKYYNDGYEYLKQIWTAAVAETPFAGHLTFKQSAPLGSDNWADALKNNTVDVLFGVGWTGSALDPYYILQAYVDPQYQYDPGWDTAAEMVAIELENELWMASVINWQKAVNGTPVTLTKVELKDGKYETVMQDGKAVTKQFSAGTSAPSEIRIAILARIEQAILEQYNMIPVGTDADAALRCHRVVFGTTEYIYGVGRGGIKYMTYTHTDAEFAAFVQSQGGNLESLYKSSASID